MSSQRRLPDEDWKEASERYFAARANAGRLVPDDGDESESAYRAAGPVSSLKFDILPAFPTVEAMTQAFVQVRDDRFLQSAEHPGFARRLTWLYPDDGCYARAALAARRLNSYQQPEPLKVFAFGSLSVKTPNSPSGAVTWWYHVVPIYRVDAQPYVFDPAIEPKKPLSLSEWLQAMSPNPSALRVSICATATYEPDNSCSNPISAQDQSATNDESDFLSQEWSRLIELNRNPEQELGASPPWSALPIISLSALLSL